MLGVLISKQEYEEYEFLKKKNIPMKKIKHRTIHCPVCNYVVDNIVPKQKYCDNCGQRFED